ncbi:hypothetical protein C1I95_21780 [Micromonospora craterilacus]|uniref:Uncharacterized protein n=1 Tax=Micromonospora craterilacus TaxID=1655439 RepID=A0A2W2FG34_9ACTN|nr:hypothetical protein [Micromonospora craterilacus]PZG14424.1 hypothetical protein C1I95_21780 [Micromonospora craterilacus]
MVIRLPGAVRSAACDAVVDRLDAGSGPGTIEIRTGGQPASAGDAASGVLLATFTLADPAFGAAAAGVAAIAVDPEPETVGVAAGTAGWWRAKDSAGVTVMDGSATVTGGGGDLTLNTVAVSIGLALRLTGGTVTMPG